MWQNLLITYAQYLIILYFLIVNAIYLFLGIVALAIIKPYIQAQKSHLIKHKYTGLEPPISVIVPAYNEEYNIVDSLEALLQTYYPDYEIIAINDGSVDRTMQLLIEAFELVPFPYVYCDRLKTQKIHHIYQSKLYPQLRVIDKFKGGKADALRAGINLAKYPLFCGVDADSILQIEGLWHLVQPFVDSQATVAAGGIIRIANGCTIQGGYLTTAKLPKNILALLQVIEYWRGFFLGRLGWSAINSMLIISGAFGLFDKQTVLNINGYNTKTVGEDMELVVHLHRHLINQQKPYRIVFVPYAVCWTECPEDLKTLQSQRIRWQRGLCESLSINKQLLFHPRGGGAGWLAFPFMLFSEVIGVFISVASYLLLGFGWYFGLISMPALQAFLVVELGLGILISLNALLLEEITFHIYPKFRQLLALFLVAIFENFGWRQLMNVWRIIGTINWLIKLESKWGNMKRKGRRIATVLDKKKSHL
jgi:cellulose synthase/poly-beta-1,6-N-acetylglucosamine synthase-like glycosyltransferase